MPRDAVDKLITDAIRRTKPPARPGGDLDYLAAAVDLPQAEKEAFVAEAEGRRPSHFEPWTVDYAIDQITDLDRLRDLARQFREAMVSQHEQCTHVLTDYCEPCLQASLRCDDDLACEAYRRRQAEYEKAMGAI